MIPNHGDSDQVKTYQAPWKIFSIGFSNNQQHPFRLGVASFCPQLENYIDIIQLNQQGNFERKLTINHRHPVSQMLFYPGKEGSNPDLLGTSGQNMKIWRLNNNQGASLQLQLKNQGQFCGILTSFDWSSERKNIIGTSSIDTTCTLWDIQKADVYSNILAHEKEVFGISFSRDRNIFGTVGADGTLRQFDLRDVKNHTVLYQTQQHWPILKLAWNKRNQEKNLVAITELAQHNVTVIDARMPSVPYIILEGHKSDVNSIAWAPQSNYHLCSVADDSLSFIWDLTKCEANVNKKPILQYRADEPITNIVWSQLQKEWIGIGIENKIQVLRL